jgi:folate-dependent phosphoribosylglycinamide formyltransferase PurN
MTRCALFTIDCAATNRAITRIITENTNDISLVITSDVLRPGRGGPIKQTITSWRRCGPAFAMYLACTFPGYQAAVALDRITASIRRRPRRTLSISETCAHHGIAHTRTADINSEDIRRQLRDTDIDLIIVFWFDQILRMPLISLPEQGIINIHAAPLPHCRGLFPVLHSAAEGGDQFGVTAHSITDQGIDSGAIIAQTPAQPPQGSSILFCDAYINEHGVDLLNDILRNLDLYLTRSQPQDPTAGSYHSYPTRADVAAIKESGRPLATIQDLITVIRGKAKPASNDSGKSQHSNKPVRW